MTRAHMKRVVFLWYNVTMKKRSTNWVIKVFTSRFFLLGAFLIALILAISFARAFYKDYEIRQQIKALQAEVEELEARRLDSLELLDYVKTDAYVEDVGRTQLGLKKPGERVIIVDASEGITSTEVVLEERERATMWKRWWKYFFLRSR